MTRARPRASATTEVSRSTARPVTRLTYSNYKIWKLPSGAAFDLKRLPSAGFYTVSVREGKILGDPYRLAARQ